MGFRLPPVSITVSGGTGSAVLSDSRGLQGRCITRGITPPSASPSATYSWYVQDQYGGIPDSNSGVGRQNWDGEKAYVGLMTFYITGASDDGVYTLDLWFSEDHLNHY